MIHNGFYLTHDRLHAESPSEQIDFDFLENIPVKQDDTLNLYSFLHGYCDVFALYLHQRYEYPIEAVFSDDGELVHCYCVHPRHLIFPFAKIAIDLRRLRSL